MQDEMKYTNQIKKITKIAKTVIPFGETASTFYEEIIRSQLGRRGLQFLQSVLDHLFAIAEKDLTISVESLLSNPDFAAFVMTTTQAAILTSNEEKLDALRNAILNFATGVDVGEDQRSVFLRAISDLTPTHIRILKVIQNPKKWLTENSILCASDKPSMEEAMRLTFPDFDERRHFYEFLHAELGSRGFAEGRIHAGAFPDKPDEKATTKLGDELLEFIVFNKNA